MHPRRRALFGAAASGTGAVASVLLGPITNYASETAPSWARNAGAVWAVFGLLGLASVGLALLSRRLDGLSSDAGADRWGVLPANDPALADLRLTSLRPPHVEPELVRGRAHALDQLMRRVRRPRDSFTVVCGAGGFGKTTLAAALAARAESSGYTVFWIRWQGKDSFVRQMTQVAVSCGLYETELQAAQTERASLPDTVWRRLRDTRKWLLVIDNADRADQLGLDGGSVRDYRGWVRPDGGGLLLLTSRDTSRETWGPRAHLVELTSLEPQIGAQVLRDTAPDAGSPAAAEQLSERLGGLPLALHSAAAYLSRPGSRYRTFDAYREALDHELGSLLGAARRGRPGTDGARQRQGQRQRQRQRQGQQRQPDEARQVIRNTWELSLDQLESAGFPVARPLLRMLSLLADAPIPRAWVTVGLLRSVSGLRVDRQDVEDALSGLHQYGLLGFADTQRVEAGSLQIHSLIREISTLLLGSAPGTDAEAWQRAALLRTAEMAGRVTTDRADWAMARTLAPHALLLFKDSAPVPVERLRGAKNKLLRALFAAGEYALAAPLARAAYERDKATYGPEHTRTDKSRHILCGALAHAGLRTEATRLMRESLAHRERTLGPTHHRTLQSKALLGTSLSRLGRHAEAAELLRETAEYRERELGPANPLTLTSRNSLANALHHAGQYADAVEMHRDVLELRLAALGPDHGLVLQSRNNLAGALGALGRNDEALTLFRETLQQRRNVLGPRHPHTLTTQHNLAETLLALGDHTSARTLLHQTLKEREQVLGPDHEETLTTRELLDRAAPGSGSGARRGAGRVRRIRSGTRRMDTGRVRSSGEGGADGAPSLSAGE